LSETLKKPKRKSREEQRQERIKRHIEVLKESEQKIGQLTPVVISRFGVVSGSKRLKANPDWWRKQIDLDNEYDYWRLVANSNIQIEPNEAEWRTYVNKAIKALKELNKKITNKEVVERLMEDFGLPRTRIYNLMDDEFKREYQSQGSPKDDETDLQGTSKDDESESPESGQLPSIIKGPREPTAEEILVKEIEKYNISPEIRVKYPNSPSPRPYYAPIKIGGIIIEILRPGTGKDEVQAKNEFFIKKGMWPINIPRPMAKKYSSVIASLIHGFLNWKAKTS